MVIICITDMFMPMATPFELQIEALWNNIFSVLQSLTSLDVSAPKPFFRILVWTCYIGNLYS